MQLDSDKTSPGHYAVHGRAWRYLAILLCFVALALKARASFLQEAPTKTSTELLSARATQQIATKRIEDVRVGDRVLATNPQRHQVTQASDPDPKTWLHLKLCVLKDSGKRLDIELIRPADWLCELDIESGGKIHLELEELGLDALADVISIEACPEIRSGAGHVVTGTFSHEPDGALLNIWIEGADEPIGCTANHPFWSVDDSDFVAAGDLKTGDRVLSKQYGSVAVREVSHRPRSERVFNLEVHNEHVYYVSAAGVLVHNAYAIKVKHKAGNQQVEYNGRRYNLPQGMTIKDISKRDLLGDRLQAAVTAAKGRWTPAEFTANEINAFQTAAKEGKGWLIPILKAQAKGRWIEAQVKREFPDLSWSGKGADITTSKMTYDIMSGTKWNMDLHARRMSTTLFRMITF